MNKGATVNRRRLPNKTKQNKKKKKIECVISIRSDHRELSGGAYEKFANWIRPEVSQTRLKCPSSSTISSK